MLMTFIVAVVSQEFVWFLLSPLTVTFFICITYDKQLERVRLYIT